MYYSDVETEKKLKELEKRLHNMYQRAYREMKVQAEEYFDKFADRYLQEYDAYQKGAYTDAEFKAWVQTQVQRGKGYEAFRDELAQRMTDANKIASAYINDATPSVYSINKDYEAYRIDNALPEFHLTDEMTVRRMANRNNHIEFKTTGVNSKKDYEWNRKQIHNALTSAILQGKSIDKLADSYMVVMKRNRNSAIRNARTSFTSAQNAGRMETYYRAENMGIRIKKEWIATFDERTRASHEALHGVRVDYDKLFSNGLMYPADPNGAPEEVYNCRCTTRAIMPNVNEDIVNAKFIAKIEAQNEDNAIKVGLFDNIKYKTLDKVNGILRPSAKECGYTLETLPKLENKETFTESLKKINPLYYNKSKVSNNIGYTKNCQRAVVALEARLRGFDVEATHKILSEIDELARTRKNSKPNPDSWLGAFEGATNRLKRITATSKQDVIETIKELMTHYGDNSRAILRYNHLYGGHVVNILNDKGSIAICDAQSGQYLDTNIFDYANLSKIDIAVVSDLELTEKTLECVRVSE